MQNVQGRKAMSSAIEYETAADVRKLLDVELKRIAEQSDKFHKRYRRHYRLSVVAALLVVAISASIAVIVHIEFSGTKLVVSFCAALTAVLSSVDHIFGCKDRARRHLRASQELEELRDALVFSFETLTIDESINESKLIESIAMASQRKHQIIQQYLRIDKPEGWLGTNKQIGVNSRPR
jgi:hypothetical protein